MLESSPLNEKGTFTYRGDPYNIWLGGSFERRSIIAIEVINHFVVRVDILVVLGDIQAGRSQSGTWDELTPTMLD